MFSRLRLAPQIPKVRPSINYPNRRLINGHVGYEGERQMKKHKSTCDRFTLSLGGMRTIASFAPTPAIAHDRLRQVRDNPAQKWRLWTPRRFRVA